MAKGEIVVNEQRCKGCGLCVEFCPQDCITITGKKISPSGFVLPEVVKSEACTACCICGWMCPDYAIDVYKYTKEK
jgi:2-oxoglutarate ferredoxin oxidoreductase subunit delta